MDPSSQTPCADSYRESSPSLRSYTYPVSLTEWEAPFTMLGQSLPLPLLVLDSDNGGEFINHHLYAYCQCRGITFTRSRTYKKNDRAHIEQTNWSVVRRLVGYDRYNTR